MFHCRYAAFRRFSIPLARQSGANRPTQRRSSMVTTSEVQERQLVPVAPGLYAEFGALYLQAGDAPKAVAMYTEERDAWPES